jgi:hypothetical protein
VKCDQARELSPLYLSVWHSLHAWLGRKNPPRQKEGGMGTLVRIFVSNGGLTGPSAGYTVH